MWSCLSSSNSDESLYSYHQSFTDDDLLGDSKSDYNDDVLKLLCFTKPKEIVLYVVYKLQLIYI